MKKSEISPLAWAGLITAALALAAILFQAHLIAGVLFAATAGIKLWTMQFAEPTPPSVKLATNAGLAITLILLVTVVVVDIRTLLQYQTALTVVGYSCPIV